MPLFTLHRNFVLRTTKGHTIKFEKGKPTHIPPLCIPDAVAIGGVPVEGEVNVLGDEEEIKPALTPTQRKEAMFKAFETMKGRNERLDFTASGLPNAKRIPALTGFEVTTRERDEFWMEFRAQEQADKDQANLDAQIARTTEAAAS